MTKQISYLLILLIATALTTPAFAQELIDKNTLKVNDTMTLNVGDDLTIGTPADFDFIHIEEIQSKINIGGIANAAAAVGNSVALIGVQAGSAEALTAGLKVAQGATTAASVGYSADAISELIASDQAKQIIGKKFRILKFKADGSKKRGYYYYAIVAGRGKTNYRIEIAPAIESKEVIGVNNEAIEG